MNDAEVVDIIASTTAAHGDRCRHTPRPQDALRAKAILRALADNHYEVRHYTYQPVAGEYPHKEWD